MSAADVRLVNVLRELKGRTERGEMEWVPAGTSSVHATSKFTFTIESETSEGLGPFVFQILDAGGRVSQELREEDEAPPGMDGDWRADLSRLYVLSRRGNPRDEVLLEQIERDLGLN